MIHFVYTAVIAILLSVISYLLADRRLYRESADWLAELTDKLLSDQGELIRVQQELVDDYEACQQALANAESNIKMLLDSEELNHPLLKPINTTQE